MKNYIRTCLSLDKETRDIITNISKTIGISKSEAVKRAVSYYYRGKTNNEDL